VSETVQKRGHVVEGKTRKQFDLK